MEVGCRVGGNCLRPEDHHHRWTCRSMKGLYLKSPDTFPQKKKCKTILELMCCLLLPADVLFTLCTPYILLPILLWKSPISSALNTCSGALPCSVINPTKSDLNEWCILWTRSHDIHGRPTLHLSYHATFVKSQFFLLMSTLRDFFTPPPLGEAWRFGALLYLRVQYAAK